MRCYGSRGYTRFELGFALCVLALVAWAVQGVSISLGVGTFDLTTHFCVVDSNGDAIPGARVHLRDPEAPDVSGRKASLVTDQRGEANNTFTNQLFASSTNVLGVTSYSVNYPSWEIEVVADDVPPAKLGPLPTIARQARVKFGAARQVTATIPLQIGDRR